MRWLRRAQLPGSVLAMLRIPPGERVLAWGSTRSADRTQTTVTVATNRALYVQATGDSVRWEHVVKATWDEPILVVTRIDDDGNALPALRVRIDDSGELPAAVHDRVVASVVVSEPRTLPTGERVLFVARRLDGDVRWTVVFAADADPGDPALRAAADAELAAMRATLGV